MARRSGTGNSSRLRGDPDLRVEDAFLSDSAATAKRLPPVVPEFWATGAPRDSEANPRMNRRSFLKGIGCGTGTLALTGNTALSRGAHTGKVGRPDGLIAFRIGTEQWLTEPRFEALLAFFREQPGVADEIAFFTSGTHPPLPLEEIRRRAGRLAERMPRVRQEGMTAGINLLATMGHHEENLDGSLQAPWQRVVDPQGRESKGSFCPAGDELLGYVVEVYRSLAEAGPDFIWIDDDVRLAGHMPIGMTCFCPGCLHRFSTGTGEQFTRESLLAAFRSGTLEQRLAWRRRWLEHNRVTLDRLFATIERTVHRIRPRLPIGFMTGDRFYEGYDFTRWATTLSGPDRSPVRWRPGGGFYSDETLAGMVGKAHDVGRQVSRLPGSVAIIQSEIENFPYDLLRKSAESTVVEASVHMAAGTTGTAFNVLSQRPDPLEEYAPLLRRIHRSRPWYRILRDELGRSPVVGVWPAWNMDSFVANQVDGTWPEGPADASNALTRSHVLGEIGLPLCYGPDGARVTVLAGPGVLAFDKTRLHEIFSGGVLMDVGAWQALDRLGASAWTGIRPGEVRNRDAIEVLSNHPLNGRFAGWSRDCRQSFWHEPAHALIPTAPETQVLARMVDYQDRDLGMAMSAFTNELGGRVVVTGYFPWTQMHHLAKSSQMKAICAWSSGDRLPVVVDSFARVHVWIRERNPDEVACVLLNASLDRAEDLVLRVTGPFRRFRWVDMEGRTTRVRASEVPGEATVQKVRVPELGAWSVGLFVGSP